MDSTATVTANVINSIRQPVDAALLAVEHELYGQLTTAIPLISEVASHLLDNGGKRIRPLLLLLTNQACSYNGQSHIPLATAIEYIHTATLLHDDVVDNSQLRRGKPTAHINWGNAASILVGDFLYSRAFQLIVKHSNEQILGLFADATNIIAEGEVQQLANRQRIDLSLEEYLAVLRNKTGKLFEVAAEVGVLLNVGNEYDALNETALAMRRFGMHLGTAFQLIDDALDYQGSITNIGKNIGDDLAKGSATLPLLYAIQNGDQQMRPLLERAVKKGCIDDLEQIQKVIVESGALAYTTKLAQEECAKAEAELAVLPDSKAKRALALLCEFAINRVY